MTATKPTKQSIVAQLRVKYGRYAGIVEYPQALTAKQRAELREESTALKAENQLAREELKTLAGSGDKLREACRFAVDVEFQEPTLTQLREALARDERAADLRDTIRTNEEKMRKLTGKMHWQRWEAYYDSSVGGISLRHIVAAGDTLEELAEKLK